MDIVLEVQGSGQRESTSLTIIGYKNSNAICRIIADHCGLKEVELERLTIYDAKHNLLNKHQYVFLESGLYHVCIPNNIDD